MSNLKDIKDLARYSVTRKVPANFSLDINIDEVDETLRAELSELVGTYNLYRRNKLDLFEIIQELADEYIPKDVYSYMNAFAEIKSYADGMKPCFKVKKGTRRARKFATRAAKAGVYETFRLDSDTVEVNTFAIGDACYIDFERYLSGEENMADYMNALLDGILHKVFDEILSCLHAATTHLAVSNMYHADSSFDSDQFAKLVNKVKAYGTGAVIFATGEFLDAMGPEAIVPQINDTTNHYGVPGVYNPRDIEDITNTGRIRQFRNNLIIEIPQSLTDEHNTTLTVDPSYCYIFPTGGGGEKIVKVGFEGNTIVDDWKLADRSMEIQAYKKMGTAIISYNNWAIYRNTGLTTSL